MVTEETGKPKFFLGSRKNSLLLDALYLCSTFACSTGRVVSRESCLSITFFFSFCSLSNSRFPALDWKGEPIEEVYPDAWFVYASLTILSDFLSRG